MKKATVGWLIAAVSLILIGCMLFLGVMSMSAWDFKSIPTTRYETNEHLLLEPFSNVAVTTDTADITLVPCEGDVRVVCYEEINAVHRVWVENDTLYVESVNNKKWYEYIGIHFGKPTVTLYVPAKAYGALTVQANTGDVTVPKDVSFEHTDIGIRTGDVTVDATRIGYASLRTTTGHIRLQNCAAATLNAQATTGDIGMNHVTCEKELTLKVTTGKTELSDVTCRELISEGNTGDLLMTRVNARDTMSLSRSTGDIRLMHCDAAALTICTDTGDVNGVLQSDKIFSAHTDTGHVDVPTSTNGGLCEVTTDTGNIRFTVEPFIAV